MWSRTHSKFYTNVTSEDIWKLWTDVNNWPSWHEGLEDCKLEGEFEVGNHFMLKPIGAPAVKILLTEIKEKQSFSDCTKFWGARMYNTHQIEVKDGGVFLSNKLMVIGPLKWLWITLVAKKVARTFPEKMDSLVKLAQTMRQSG